MNEVSAAQRLRETDGTADALSVVSIVSTAAFLLSLLLTVAAMLTRAYEGGEQSMLMGFVFLVTAPVTTVCAGVACARIGFRRARLARWSLGLHWLSMPALLLLAQLLALFGVGGAK
ncbi:MAG: hypothetical protein Q8N18_10645 [Opitutaceae bacterium]|nr:hypothetical protein [Opitutaceae bacterium]